MRLLIEPAVRRAFFLLWCLGWAVLLAVCLTPSPPLAEQLSDKLAHLAAFAAMSAAVAGFCHERRELPLWAGSALAVGAVIELAQALTPSRSAELGDLFADAAGVALGTGLAWLWLALVIEPLRRRARPV